MGKGMNMRPRSSSANQLKRKRSRSRGGEIEEEDIDDFAERAEETIAEVTAAEKYKAAASVVQKVLGTLIENAKDGASGRALCQMGDSLITEGMKEHFGSANDEDGDPLGRGLASPTTIGVNHVVCGWSPAPTDEDILIRTGDIVRFDLSGHIDGYVATTAHTIIVDHENAAEPGEDGAPVVDPEVVKRAMRGAWQALGAVARKMTPGTTSHVLTDVIARVAHAYGLRPTQGVVSHRMARYEECGDQVFLNCEVVTPMDTQCQDDMTVRHNSVWSLDVALMSADAGRDESNRLQKSPKFPTNIYKRSERMQLVNLKASKQVLSHLRGKGKAGLLPFASHSLPDLVKTRFGVKELITKGLLDEHPVMETPKRQVLARFKWTIFVKDNGTVERVCGGPQPDYIEAMDLSNLPEEVKSIFSTQAGAIAGRKIRRAKRQKLAEPEGNPE